MARGGDSTARAASAPLLMVAESVVIWSAFCETREEMLQGALAISKGCDGIELAGSEVARRTHQRLAGLNPRTRTARGGRLS